jgi:agmatinase
MVSKTLLTSYLAATVAGYSFLDFNFGPLSLQDNKGQGQAQEQQPIGAGTDDDPLSDFNHGFTKIPEKDFTGDLSSGPLFAGIVSFAHLPILNCLNGDQKFDIAVVGAPFDTAVSYRNGARFGPSGIRDGSRRMAPGTYSAFDPESDPLSDAVVVDCGDIAMTPFDNRIALDQLYRGERAILKNKAASGSKPPRIVTLGGDHTVTFSAIRAVSEVHGPVTVLHFDSHIDTWHPVALGGNVSSYSQLNHGTFLHYAHEKGFLTEHGNMHIGVRAPYVRKHKDLENDKRCGFESILAREIDTIGVDGISQKIKNQAGTNKVYISVDIDVLDPAYAPGTGTAEAGGFTTREFLTLLDSLKGLNVVGADVVEVSPPYDTNAQITALAASEVANSLFSLIENAP